MQKNINQLMDVYQISFGDLAVKLNISKQTLTRKMNGSTDWTYQEMILMAELFHRPDPFEFFIS